jgi:POT family proton-dependent oligopeptide transporter
VLVQTFFGHPRGLATLFFTEMWERFTYYGMRALLVLFLVAPVAAGGFGIDDRTAAAIYGLYTASTYLAALPGGWIADRLVGARLAVLIGGIGITLGNVLLAMSVAPRGFYLGLVAIALGVGLLKPNASVMVGDLYPEGGARLDAGFTLYYIGINLGSALGPIVTGAAAEFISLRAGFAAAAIFMALGIVQFHLTRRHLGTAGLWKDTAEGGRRRARPWLPFCVTWVLGCTVLLGCTLGVIPISPVPLAHAAAWLIAAVALLFFLYLLLIADLSGEERRHGCVLVVLFLGSALFWSGYEQGGSSLNLFAERYTDRAVTGLHFLIPTAWFQSLNPVFIILFAPAFAWGWIALARRHLNPSVPAKFAIGVILMGCGFLVMVAAAALAARGAKVSPDWLVLTYLFHTFGELCVGPVGLSYFTKLSPRRFVGQMMGMFFLSLSLGNLIAGLIAGEFDAEHLASMPAQYLKIVYFSIGLGALLLISSRPVRRLMGKVQ